MSRNFYTLHVHAPTEPQRKRVVAAVAAQVERAGFERVTRTAGADRVIRIGGRAPWLTIDDDGREHEALATAVARATKRPILEAYCEASAIVWLSLRAEGKHAGAWGEGRRPPARLVDPLLVQGNAKAFAAAWDEGARQIFPETALAVAAKHFGIPTRQLFGEIALRGTTLAFRRKKAAWTPRHATGAPEFRVGWGSNGAFGGRHMIFEGARAHHRVQITSLGGPSRGLALRLTGSAISEGLVEIQSVGIEGMTLVRDGDVWRDPAAAVPASLVDPPDLWSLGDRERKRAQVILDASERWVDVAYRGLRHGDGTLTLEVETQGAVAAGSLELTVMWKPYRPRAAVNADNHQLFSMHRRDSVYAYITLRASLAEGWGWAGPHARAWAVEHGEDHLAITRDGEVVLRESDEDLSWHRVAEHLTDASKTLQVAGTKFLFGTFAYPPYGWDAREPLVVQLILTARSDDDEAERLARLARLAAICDEAIARGLAWSAIVGEQQYNPGELTTWEQATIGHGDPPKLAAWHATHLRGLDKRVWMSAEHAARVDRGALARHVEVTPVGSGLRLQMAADRPRADFAPLEDLLAELLPSHAELERWRAGR